MTRVVGICGLGMMGSAVASRLSASGVRVLTASRGRSATTRRRAETVGVVDVGTLARLASEADVILSIMGSATAIECARDLATAAGAREAALVFADCNIVSVPELVDVAGALQAAGVTVVDAGIVGPPRTTVPLPCFYVSGERAEELKFLSDYGFRVEIIGERVGQATMLKLCSSAVHQGCLALMTEVVLTAAHHGIDELLLGDLRAHFSLLYEWFTGAVAGAPDRAARWSADMLVMADTIEGAGLNRGYHDAAHALYTRVAELPSRQWKDFDEMLDALLDRPGGD